MKFAMNDEYKKNFKNRNYLAEKLTKSSFYYTGLFLKFLRKEEFHYNRKHFIRFLYFRMRKNIIGVKLGFYIPKNVVDSGIVIHHTGSIVINDHAKIGKNLQLHGNNCIGNDGINLDKAPVIGDNVDVGFGAILIGNIKIGNNVTIGAGAVVINSFNEDNIVIAGCPAKIVKRL